MLACSVCLLTSCFGDHSSKNGKDTVNNRYGVSKDTSKVDTSKMKSNDNSASGGTSLVKDTSKKTKP